MSQDGDEQNMGPASENAGDTPEGVGTPSLAHSVASRLCWTQRAVSPWVRRTLAAGKRDDAAGRRVSTALSYGATSRFLRRAQRMVEGGRAWAPELGTLDPRNVARFTEQVTARFPGAGKHTVTWLPEEEADHANEFPLPGEAQAQAARPAREGRSPAPDASVGMSGPPAPAIRAGRAGSYDGTATARPASSPSGRPATAQRAPVRRAPPPRPTREPTGRLFSRVEELPARRMGADAGADELPLQPETRSVDEGLAQGVTAVEPGDEEAFSAEAGSQAAIQRRAYSAPPARGEGAGGGTSRPVGARAPGEQAPGGRTLGGQASSQGAGRRSRPPDRGISPALQRTAGIPEGRRGENMERGAGAPMPPPAAPDDGPGGVRAQWPEEEARGPDDVPGEPAVEQLQRRSGQQQGQASPVRAEGARQVESAPPDRSRAAQQAGTSAAAQSSTAQEDAPSSPGVPQGDEVVAPGSGEDGLERTDASTAPGAPGRAQRAAEMAAPEAAQDRSERIQPQVEGVQQQGMPDRSSVSPGGERPSVQREPLRPAQAPSRAGDLARPAGAATQEEGGPRAEGALQQEAARRSVDRAEETAPTEHTASDRDASVSSVQRDTDGIPQPPRAREGVIQAAPVERPSLGSSMAGKAPSAPGTDSQLHDAVTASSAGKENAGERLPLASQPAERELLAGNEPADRIGAAPGTDGAVTVQRQEGPAVGGGAGERGPRADSESEVSATGQASGPGRIEATPTRADAEPAARSLGEPPDSDAVQRSSVAAEAHPGRAAASDATDTDEVDGYAGDQAGQAGIDGRPDASAAGEPAAPSTVQRSSAAEEARRGVASAADVTRSNERDDLPGDRAERTGAGVRQDAPLASESAAPGTVRRSSVTGEAHSGTMPAPEATGAGHVEGQPGGEARPEGASLQRRAIDLGGSAIDARDSIAPDTTDATTVPPRGARAGEGSYADAPAGGKGGEERAGARLGLVRPVLQTRPVEQTAILPQLRRSPAQPGARLSQIPSRGEPGVPKEPHLPVSARLEPGVPGMGAPKESYLPAPARLSQIPVRGEPGVPGMGAPKESYLPASARLSQIPARGEPGVPREPYLPASAGLSQIPSRGEPGVPGAGVPAITVRPPVQPVVQPVREAVIQRQPSIPSAAISISRAETGETVGVQRAEEEEVAPGAEGRDEEQDLDRLAREVYPLVKRLLAIERERRAGRWR